MILLWYILAKINASLLNLSLRVIRMEKNTVQDAGVILKLQDNFVSAVELNSG